MSAQIGFNPTATIADAEYASSGRGFGLLDTNTDHRGRVWLFVHANGAITGPGYVVVVDENGEASMTNASMATGDRIGVAATAFADNDYGWVQIYGVCDAIQVAASTAANIALNTSATAGQLGTAAGDAITGVALTTARGGSAGTAPGHLNFPVVGATV